MKLSVILGLIVAVHVAVFVVVMTPGCVSANPQPGGNQPTTVEMPPDIPVMPPTVETEPVVANPIPVALPPVVEPVDIPEAPAIDNIYVIQNGDSLSKIAARHGIKTAELQELNNIADPNKIRIGQKLVLPAHAKPSQSKPTAGASAPAPAKAKTEAAAVAADGVYVVKSGDALSKIAKAHGVKQADLMALNGITDANKIRIGQKLKIPGVAPKADAPKADAPKTQPATPASVPAAEPPAQATDAAPVEAPALAAESFEAPAAALDFTVNAGDSVETLAALFSVSPDELRRVNHLAPDAEVTAGQHIIIPPAGNP